MMNLEKIHDAGIIPRMSDEDLSVNIEAIGERLRALRIARGYQKQRDFYPALNIAQSNASRYENGEVAPSLARLKQFARRLDAPIEYLIDGIDDRMTVDLRRRLDELGVD